MSADELMRKLADATKPSPDQMTAAELLKRAAGATRPPNTMTTLESLIAAMDRARIDFARDINVPWPLPKIEPVLPEDTGSARVFLTRLRKRVEAWQENLPADVQPVVFAVLANGAVVRVSDFEEDGQNGVVVRGVHGGCECMVLVHQTSLQLICIAEVVVAPEEKRSIGFKIGGSEE